MHEIFHLLLKKPVIVFSELFKEVKNKFEIVTTFLALLELIRLKEIIAFQEGSFAEIKIERNPSNIKPVTRQHIDSEVERG